MENFETKDGEPLLAADSKLPEKSEICEKPKLSLRRLYEMLDVFGGIAADQIKADITEKVDNYKLVSDAYYERAKLMRQYAKDFAAAAKSMDGTADRILDLLLYNLKERGLTEEVGDKFRVSVCEREVLNFTPEWEQASADKYLAFPELIERKYSWKKEEVNSAYKEDPSRFDGILVKAKTPYVQFGKNTMKKGK